MAAFTSPFAKTGSIPGKGEVHIILLPPGKPLFKTLNYTYPLKLIPSSPHILSPSSTPYKSHDASSQEHPLHPISVPLLFLLSYGGGLLPPDTIDLHMTLDPRVRLTIATQGSTKIFPSRPFQSARASTLQTPLPSVNPNSLPLARQSLYITLGPYAALCLTPDPSQPFRGSRYHQHQSFTLHPTSSLLLLDWTTEGRRARGESWDALFWRGCNEIWMREPTSSAPGNPQVPESRSLKPELRNLAAEMRQKVAGTTNGRRLVLRDQVILEAGEGPGGMSGQGMEALKADGVGCFGTLVAVGEVVKGLGEFFVAEFEALPRVGGRRWDDEVEGEEGVMDDGEERRREREREKWRQKRLRLEKDENVLWNAARVRGLVMVKFTARDAHGARHWLGQMLGFEGTVAREFGPGGLMSVR